MFAERIELVKKKNEERECFHEHADLYSILLIL